MRLMGAGEEAPCVPQAYRANRTGVCVGKYEPKLHCSPGSVMAGYMSLRKESVGSSVLVRNHRFLPSSKGSNRPEAVILLSFPTISTLFLLAIGDTGRRSLS